MSAKVRRLHWIEALGTYAPAQHGWLKSALMFSIKWDPVKSQWILCSRLPGMESSSWHWRGDGDLEVLQDPAEKLLVEWVMNYCYDIVTEYR